MYGYGQPYSSMYTLYPPLLSPHNLTRTTSLTYFTTCILTILHLSAPLSHNTPTTVTEERTLAMKIMCWIYGSLPQ